MASEEEPPSTPPPRGAGGPPAPSPSPRTKKKKKKAAAAHKWRRQLDLVVGAMVTRLRRREVRGSSTVAAQTAQLLLTVVGNGQYDTVQELLDMVRSVGVRLQRGCPVELAIGNIVRRVLFIIRQESTLQERERKENKPVGIDIQQSLHTLLDADDPVNYSEKANIRRVKENVVEEIAELVDEISTSYTNIAEQAVEHVHAQEVILTYGVSRTVTEFFREAAKLRHFKVIVAESAPSFAGHKMAAQLSDMGIDTTLITDSAVVAMMPAVNKVVVGTHAVMANGGLLNFTGGHNIAMAAKMHSVPFVVVTGLYKLCPLYTLEHDDTFQELGRPSDVLQFAEEGSEQALVVNPLFDYVPPELVSLFITNHGGHNPNYVYRLLAEYYLAEDYELE